MFKILFAIYNSKMYLNESTFESHKFYLFHNNVNSEMILFQIFTRQQSPFQPWESI